MDIIFYKPIFDQIYDDKVKNLLSEEGLEKWQEAKELSKNIGIRYDPAIEAINTARQLLQIHDEINAFGTLER